jgi:hypothetical protein
MIPRGISGAALLTAACVAVASVSLGSRAQTPPPPQVQDVLTLTASYLEAYERQFSAIVADEAYSMSSFFGSRTGWRSKELQSDLVLLSLRAGDWMQFRDVYTVDGQPVRDHDQRLQKLLEEAGSDVYTQAGQIANEGARYNLGVYRNFNIPTMALTYLTEINQPRSTFKLTGTKSIADQPALELTFRETARPSKIRSGVRNVRTSGRFWVRADSGAVVASELKIDAEGTSLTGAITVEYAFDPQLKFLVPVAMSEHYTGTSGEIDQGHATYSHFRQFAVNSSTIVGRGGGGGGH